MSYKSVYDFNQIDLTRHGLIEASAGTGKTYTIENLVVRLLKERDDLELENILLVTFTEKAASELKIRIREKLEGALDDSIRKGETSKKLGDALDGFDTAPIHTIHGFCQSMLSDFAFENSVLFESEVINDAPLFEGLLKEQMRKDWPEIYGGHLREILEISGFNRKKGSFLDTIIRLAKSLHEEAGDRLLPDLKGRGFEEIKGEITTACMETKSLLGSEGEFSRGFAQLNFNAGSRKSILEKIVVPVEDYFSDVQEDKPDIRALADLMAKIDGASSTGRKGLKCLIPEKWNKGGDNPEVCPNLETVKKGLEEVNAGLNDLIHTLAVEAVHRLQDDVTRTKQRHGLISYYDMLSLVEKALHGDNSSNLLKKLRNRFKVAFIDEFQDTDPVQWRIFRRIFIDTNNDDLQNLLFLIGDPKQAIYSFRGADVYAYLLARNEMEMLERRGKAALYSLSVNWRSKPELITAFNDLFCGEAWFTPQDLAGNFEIGYQKTGFPKEEDRPGAIISDNSGRPVLNIVDLSAARSPGPAKPRLARFVAQEIDHLISSDIRIKEKGEPEKRIGFGDICILVRTKSEVPFIEEELSRLKIPYTFYRKPGLFVSDEAVYTSLLFHAILDPTDSSAVKKGLLTPFFGLRLPDLFAYEEMPPSHPVKQILFKWNGYAMSRKWSYLFQSLMEESGLLSRGTAESGWDRKYANYRQIFEFLEDTAYRNNLDFRGLSAVLDIYRKEALEADDEAGIHQIETEARKVQIMTLHVSKGLEFPVVFVAGGLTKPASHLDHYYTYHIINKDESSLGMTRILDLAKSGGAERHEGEKSEEDKRLYYVASTRARVKLYLPFYIYKNQNAPWLGPVCTRVSPALLNAFPKDAANRDVLWLDVDHHSGAAEGQRGSGGTEPRATVPAGDTFEIFSLQERYQQRRIRLGSFSSLHKRIARGDEAVDDGPSFRAVQEGREDDEGLVSQGTDIASSEGAPDEIPGGTDVGLMFHDILEHIDYDVVLRLWPSDKGHGPGLMGDPGTREIILRYMEAYRIALRWKDYISRVIWNTLTTPVTTIADDFILAHLNKEERLHEVEFYYPFRLPVTGSDTIPDCEIIDGFIRGFVDLIFRKDQKFYMADWKSNYIETGYDPESMEKSMDDADYHLQYRLYAIALLRWLKQVRGERFDPERDFGGVFYFYLRGMGAGKGHGIYYVPPDQLGALDQLEEEIASIFEKGRR